MAEQHIENVEQVEVEEKPKTRKVKRVSWHMIPQSQTGGPHGFGKESFRKHLIKVT